MQAQGSLHPRIAAGFALALGLSVCAVLIALAGPSVALAVTYYPLNIISDDNWRASTSMSQADVRAFLNAQPGVLKTYSCAEGGPNGAHLSTVKTASRIIWEAAQYWGVNPKLVLATLQKEQSLLSLPWHAATDTCPSTAYHLTNAMGCGVYAGSPDRHPGFGDQVWTGTQKLGQTTGLYAWYPGKRIYVHSYPDSAAAGPGSNIHIWITPVNQPTWNFYTYTPYYPQKGVWTSYVRYFGDPLVSPAVRPVYRFYNKKVGSHFYTISEGERWNVISKLSGTYRYEGPAYSINTSNTANSAPLYRFYNAAKGTHFYTASETEKDSVIAKLSKTYRFEGPAYNVSLTADGAAPVYRFYNLRNGTHFYTVSEAEKNSVISKLASIYRFEGVAFYIAP